MQRIGRNLLCRATPNSLVHSRAASAQILSYKTYGASPTPKNVPIIVLHDFLATKKNWDKVCKNLNVLCKKTVIAVDARNHGESPYCKTHDYKSLAADISNLLISQFEVEKCIMIGHSMGGRTAMMMALNQPTRVASLVVVDISPVSTSSYIEITLPKLLDILMSVDFKGMTLTEAKAAAKEKIEESKICENEVEVEALLKNIAENDDKKVAWTYNLPVLKKQAESFVKFPLAQSQYKGPTLFLAGKLSFCIPTDNLPKIQQYFPAARLLYIENVGHNLHLEAPELFLNAILTFLDFNDLLQTEPAD